MKIRDRVKQYRLNCRNQSHHTLKMVVIEASTCCYDVCRGLKGACRDLLCLQPLFVEASFTKPSSSLA